MTLIHLHSVSK